jgi:hypothetical protein
MCRWWRGSRGVRKCPAHRTGTWRAACAENRHQWRGPGSLLDQTPHMDELDRYSFDTAGYVVMDDVLTASQVGCMTDILEERGVTGGRSVDEQRFAWHGELLTWDRSFRDLIDHPVVLDALATFIGPQVRLDNVYGVVVEPGSVGLGLHGPAQPYDPAQYYRHEGGITRCGMLGFGWALNNTPPDGGGFGCIPGSHHISTPPPPDADDLVQPVA